MPMISNINDQVQEQSMKFERNYSKRNGIPIRRFEYRESSTSATNFSTFLTMFRSKLISSGLVMSMGGNGLTQKFRKK